MTSYVPHIIIIYIPGTFLISDPHSHTIRRHLCTDMGRVSEWLNQTLRNNANNANCAIS